MEQNDIFIPIGDKNSNKIEDKLKILIDTKADMDIFTYIITNSIKKDNHLYCPYKAINKTKMGSLPAFNCTRQTIQNRLSYLIDSHYIIDDKENKQYIINYNNKEIISIPLKLFSQFLNTSIDYDGHISFTKIYLYLKYLYEHSADQCIVYKKEIFYFTGISRNNKRPESKAVDSILKYFNDNNIIKMKFSSTSGIEINEFPQDSTIEKKEDFEIKVETSIPETFNVKSIPQNITKKSSILTGDKILPRAYIYAIIIGDKLGYIGITKRDLRARMGEHVSNALTIAGNNSVLYEAMRKEPYFFEIWEKYINQITYPQLKEREKELIEELHPLYNTIGIKYAYF